MNTHGGRRPGSGRKPRPKRITVCIEFPPAVHAALEAEKNRLGFSWPVLIQQLAENAGIIEVGK